jgi:hypothetical protein
MLAAETDSYDFYFQVLKDGSRPAGTHSIWSGKLAKVSTNYALRQ